VGSRYYELGEIRSRVPELAPGKVPDLNALQQELAQLNRTPDRQVAPIMKPGRTPGTVDVDLSVKDELPVHGELEVDNHRAAFTSALRLNAALRYDNLWQREHSFGVNFQVSPQNTSEVNVLYGTYLWKFRDVADVVSLYGVRSNSNIAVVGSSTVLGHATIAGVRWIHPFESTARYFHSVTLGLDRKDFGQTNVNAQTGEPDVLPAIRYMPISLSYSGTWTPSASSQLQFSFGPSTAPRGVFGNSDAEFAGRRVEVGAAGYMEFKYNLSFEDRFARHFGGAVKVDGQATADPLIPNEQYTAGGFESVRGYREAEVLGDRGTRANVELRASPWPWATSPDAPTIYSLAFFDIAYLRTIDPLGPQRSLPVTVISSTGLGLRASGWHGFRLDADWARALRDGARGVNGVITPRGSSRFDLGLDYLF
jgi:hemolysin activation/secretion protein